MSRTTEYRYNEDGKLVELTLWNEATGAEVTRWEYGVTKAENGVASHELLRCKVYPDSDDLVGGQDGLDGEYDRVEYRYNALGEVVEQKDQNGTVHGYGYDKLGRLVSDVVMELDEGVDGAVRAIGRSYDVKGQLEKVTSYGNVEMTEVVNEVQFGYGGFGQVTQDYQAHAGAVNVGTTPKASYEYAVGGAENTARLEAMIYPGGRRLEYDYGLDGEIDDLLDRVRDVVDGTGGPHLARYTKRGVNATVRVEYLEPEVELTYIKEAGEPVGDGGDQYTGLDRFNRIEDIRWIDRGGETAVDIDRYQYGFDRAGNRRWRRNVVAASLGLDEAYTYDGLYQLTELERGNLNINRSTVGGVPGWDEAFQYDQAGNWERYVTRVGGVADLEQARRHNRANEITFIDGSNATVGYDGVGNMTRMPKVGAWETGQVLSWDAWNRLVRVEEGALVIGQYAYDGLTRRIWKVSIEGGMEVKRHGYYSTQWQLLEERLDDSSAVERQFVWGLRYIDDLILRDSATFPSAERIYATHDQWHVTGLLHAEGDVLERYNYTAFGVSTVMDADWETAPQSQYGWEIRYGAYRWDVETGMYCVRYRYLHPDLGRWVSRDPIGEEDHPNILSYIGNNSLMGTDPSGLFCNCACECAETLEASATGPVVGEGARAQKLEIKITLSYFKTTNKGFGVKLKWWECTNRPALPGVPADKWVDIYNRFPEHQGFADFNSRQFAHPEECRRKNHLLDASPRVPVNDVPGGRAQVVVGRWLYIIVVVENPPECKCAKKNLAIMWKQNIAADGEDRGGFIDPTKMRLDKQKKNFKGEEIKSFPSIKGCE